MLTRIYKEDKDAFKEYLMSRTQDLSTDVLVTVSNIIQDVKENKDEACLKYTQQFDKVSLDTMEVSQEEWDAQILKCDDSVVVAMKLAKKNIEDFHKLQKQNGYLLQKEKGIYLGQRVLPLEAVGIYVPGGRAQYPSSVLMNALPAKIAGVQNVVMVTPPDKNGTIHPNIAYAAKLAGLDTLPVIVRQMSDDAAVILMVDSNLQREHILPSERAFAYKMKLEALKNQGARSDLTCGQFGHKLIGAKARDIVADESGDNARNVQRFIRLTSLIPELLDMVDEKKISFNPAVELSYLDESQQRDFLEAMADTQNAPSLSQAQRLKKLAQGGHFSDDVAFAVMGEPKKDELDKVVIKNDTLRKYFPESSNPREMEEKIIVLLEESITEKVVFRSDSIKKYFPSNYSSEQIEISILKMLDQRMKKRMHEAER